MQNVHTLGNILLVGAGGFIGSAARYSVSLLMRCTGWEMKWPLPTLVVNVFGSFLIGLLWGKVMHSSDARLWMTLGIAGFCGGFTTFSSFSYEVLGLFRAGATGLGLLYITSSVLLCLLAVWLGLNLMKA